MRWSNLKGQQWGGATLPMRHDGHFYNMEMQVYLINMEMQVYLINMEIQVYLIKCTEQFQ